MAVKIRLSRMGSKHKPYYRVVVADSRMPRDGRFIEVIGQYDPTREPSFVNIDKERALKWLSEGAKPSAPVEKLLKIANVIPLSKPKEEMRVKVEKGAEAPKKKTATAKTAKTTKTTTTSKSTDRE